MGLAGFAADIIIYVAAAGGLAVSSCCIYYDLTVGFRKIFQRVIEKSKLADRLYSMFLKTILSVINIMKARKMKSPLLLTIRNIGYADALVSILFLQTAMFTAFSGVRNDLSNRYFDGSDGNKREKENRRNMNP